MELPVEILLTGFMIRIYETYPSIFNVVIWYHKILPGGMPPTCLLDVHITRNSAYHPSSRLNTIKEDCLIAALSALYLCCLMLIYVFAVIRNRNLVKLLHQFFKISGQ